MVWLSSSMRCLSWKRWLSTCASRLIILLTTSWLFSCTRDITFATESAEFSKVANSRSRSSMTCSNQLSCAAKSLLRSMWAGWPTSWSARMSARSAVTLTLEAPSGPRPTGTALLKSRPPVGPSSPTTSLVSSVSKRCCGRRGSESRRMGARREARVGDFSRTLAPPPGDAACRRPRPLTTELTMLPAVGGRAELAMLTPPPWLAPKCDPGDASGEPCVANVRAEGRSALTM
mmetsp:Transcript_4079/g.10310  ORF Transcript_4079/g.10310 Transcript_4079/m.10310 type:complete len:232 (+) Transcript_4079:302-997(+)